MPALEVSYTIVLPIGHTVRTTSPSTGSFSHPLDASTPQAHLQSLEHALGEARKQMNERLTEWKDELRDAEKEKEKKGRKKGADEDDDEEEEEEDESA
ncbi:hypothetical protein JCM10207_005781 [Rhodosporidiobolus poonsookiae]